MRVLEENHDSVTAGHLGIKKTINRIATRYYWSGMSRDIIRYVRRCQICQKHKLNQQKPAEAMLTKIPGKTWSIICADFIDPLPKTKHDNTMQKELPKYFVNEYLRDMESQNS